MTRLKGIVAEFQTSNDTHSESGDNFFLGIISCNGGREFRIRLDSGSPLNQRGATKKFYWGSVWNQGLLQSAEKITHSTNREINDPEIYPLEIENVESVYVRKQGDNTDHDDDLYKFEKIHVILFGDNRLLSRYTTNAPLMLANESGHQVWLSSESDSCCCKSHNHCC